MTVRATIAGQRQGAEPLAFALNPSLNVGELAQAYRQKRRLQIRDFLTPEAAKAISVELHGLPYGLTYNDGGRTVELDAHAVQQLGGSEAQRIGAVIREGARSGFQFVHSYYPILDDYLSPAGSNRSILRVCELLNSQTVLDLVRGVTGVSEILWASARATLYKPGHFMKAHTDMGRERGLEVAFVMNFTPRWDPDWGGLLQFWDDDRHVEQAFSPRYNSLSIFRIPAPHSVSAVAPYVNVGRVAISGTFRSDEPPAQIGRRKEERRTFSPDTGK